MKTVRKAAQWPIILVIAGLGAVVAACSQPPVPQDRFYRLQVPPPAAALPAPRLPGVLEVPRFAADGLLAARPIVFSEADAPAEVNAYYYHFWVEPPGVMLRDLLVAHLRAAGVAKMVVTPELRLEPDFTLTARIKRLEQVRGASPRAVIVLDVAVNGRKEDHLVLLKTYAVEQAAADNGVPAAVEAMSRALAIVFQGVVSDLPPAP